MAKTELKEIPLNQLIIDKFNARGGEWISDENLIESIRKQGVLEPLLVRPLKNKFSVVCGSRRFFASKEARLKTVPCIIKVDLTDVNALGMSLQENLQSNSLDRVQEAEAIAKLWEMLDGGRNYEDRIKEMDKQFGLRETSVKEYLLISRLSDKIKGLLKPTPAGSRKLDRTTAAGISAADWKEDEKYEAAKILSEVESPKDRRKMLSKMKSYKDLSPMEAFEKVRKIPQGQTYYVYLDAKMVRALDKATEEENLDAETLIKDIVEKWLRKSGYLN